MIDPILLWNEVALEANRVSHTNGLGEQAGPPLSARALAIIHLAMYDSYVVTSGAKRPRYQQTLPPLTKGADPSAAVAGAAFKALGDLFPSQKPFFQSILDATGVVTGTDDEKSGYQFGYAVAEQLIKSRSSDPGAAGPYKPNSGNFKHRVDPDNAGQGFHAPLYGDHIDTFAVTQRLDLDDAPTGYKYLEALMEVRAKGIKPELMGTLPANLADHKRTPDETLMGIFWGYDGSAELGTPPRLYNQIVRILAAKRSPRGEMPNTVEENAVLFALVNVALADAGILCWEQKYRHELWRPVVGIREHDVSIGLPDPSTCPTNETDADGDPFWLPLGGPLSNRLGKNFTPNFPSYPSGHATFGAAALHIARLFYNTAIEKDKGDNLAAGLEFVSEELNGATTDNLGTVRPRHVRNFPQGFWQMILENGRSRVLLGVHWVFDAYATDDSGKNPDLSQNIGGVPLGLNIAENINTNFTAKKPEEFWESRQKPLPSKPKEVRLETHANTYLPGVPSR